MKYPLKQTKERGDITGFQRITWEEALKDIADRLKAVQGKYGAEAFHPIYACGNIASSFQGGSYTGLCEVNDFGKVSPALRLLGGCSAYTSDYSFHQGSYMGAYGTAYSGMINMTPTPEFLGTDGEKHFVMWGSNIPTTHNPKAFSWVKGMEDMKKKGGTVTFIGPEFSEVGISQADKWIQSKPYTDVALIMGMLYHMIDLTFDKDGNIKNGGLDVDYLDTMVYGFFETPEYWRLANGDITTTNPNDDTAVYVAAIPAGQSLSAYIMGDDDRLTKAKYSASGNYMAKQFEAKSSGLARNTYVANFTFTNSSNTKYAYKADMNEAKTPAWASRITGIPEAAIQELAIFYLRCGNNRIPVYNEWAGGQLKQNDGTVTLYALQALLIISKNWGITGTGIANNAVGVHKEDDPNQIPAGALRPEAWDNPEQIPNMSPHPKISVTQWHNAIKLAFSEKLKDNGYEPNIPDWTKASGNGKPKYTAGKKGQVYFDDGGVKSLVNRQGITGVGITEPKTFTVSESVTMPNGTSQSVTHTYYDFKGNTVSSGGSLSDQTSSVEFSGFRFILNVAGNIPINQHANPIDSARMYKALPTYGYGAHSESDMAEAFYLVTFDNFMSPSARYSDYVLPAQTTWEQADFVNIENSGNLYVDAVKPGPGESKSSWEFMRDLINAYDPAKTALFTGSVDGKAATEIKFNDVVKDRFEKNISKDSSSPFYGKTWEQFLAKPISHAKPVTQAAAGVTHAIRKAYEDYKAGGNTNSGFNPHIMTVDWSCDSWVFGFCNDTYDTRIHGFAETESCPKQTGMFQVYSDVLVWRYENLYSKWHGYLPKANQGQINKDEDGDPIVYPIPIYFNYEDHFRVAYGLDDNADLDGRYLMTTTHDRFRAHSSQAENPYLRELTHRVQNGGLYSGNDYGYYAVADKTAGNENTVVDFPFTLEDSAAGIFSDESFPYLNQLIDENGLPKAGFEKRASYADIWVNDEDFADMPDGTLVKVYNEIGAVLCTIRKTARCVPGYVGLHQGCWFDPRGDVTGDDVLDVGGCVNTLMPSTPSRMDHGNGVQSGYVKIEKYTGK